MRVVLDTKVLVSAALTAGGTCDRIVRAAIGGDMEVWVDVRIVDEYLDVLRRPRFKLAATLIEELLEGLARWRLVIPRPLDVDLPDPTDLPFLEIAAAARAVLVTGNKKHSPPSKRKGVNVVSPAELLALLAR